MKALCLFSALSLFLIFSAKAEKAKASADTIVFKFGQYYIDSGEANLPVLQIKDGSGQINQGFINRKPNKMAVSYGPLDRYSSTIEVLSGKVKIRKRRGHTYILTPDMKSGELFQLKITHLLKGDAIKVILREWADKSRTNYVETVEILNAETTIWLLVK